ncbi:hypothetical protein KFL_004430045 [Klebsormidium nitens]|uniref:Uncharacterized protein n=1 Tax=Klebsormidium nitens TaxID=105231 RepID=A0A1Y1ICF5_KLENI|nr:hypothetical protein KFL_004430045 [Klebsormidium nitens]|eukprot:GAQ88600.1 hypothetical protein KFL_004430045 [Klebsormidium nitens]
MEHVFGTKVAKESGSTEGSLANGAELVRRLIEPTVILPQSKAQGGEAPLDEEHGPADHPVEEETVRAPRSTSFRVAIEEPKVMLAERWLINIRAQANAIASESTAEAQGCMNSGGAMDFIKLQSVLEKLRRGYDKLMTPPSSVHQQFVELRNRLAAEKAPAAFDSSDQAKVCGWTTESRHAEAGSKFLVARAVTRSLVPALKTNRVSVMPLCALPQRGVVPEVSGNPAVIMKVAEEDCKGDRCICRYVPAYWPFLLRCCLRIVTHKYVNTNVPLAEQLSHIAAGSSSLTFGLMQVRKTRIAAQSVWALRFIFGQLPVYYTMARNIIQSRYNIWTALEDVNKDVRALLTAPGLGLTLTPASTSIFEAIPVRNLHVIPMLRDLPEDREYDPLCLQQVVVRSARADMVAKTVDFEGGLVEAMMAPLLESRQLMRATSQETGKLLYPISVTFDEWDLCRQSFCLQKGGRVMIGALDRGVFRGTRDGARPLVESVAAVAGITATPFALLGLQTALERPLRVVLLAPETGTYYGLPYLADPATVQYHEVELVVDARFAVTENTKPKFQLEKHPAVKRMIADMVTDYRAIQAAQEQPPNSHVHGLVVNSVRHGDHMQVAYECLDHFEREGVPAIALIDNNGKREAGKTAMTYVFPETLVKAGIPSLFVLPGLNEQGQLDLTSQETVWTDALFRTLPEQLQRWLLTNNGAIRGKQLEHLAIHPNELLFPGHLQADLRCYALQLEWELMWSPTLWKRGVKGLIMMTVAGTKANRANAYKTIYHCAHLTHAYFYISMKHEASNAEMLLQRLGRICTTQYGPGIKRLPKLYLPESVHVLLQACQTLYKRVWQRIAAARGAPVDQDIIHNEQFKHELAALVMKHSQKLKVSRRDINEGVFAGHTAVCKDGILVRQFRSEMVGKLGGFSAVDRDFPLGEVDLLDPEAVETARRELLASIAKEYVPKGQSLEDVMKLIRVANRVVFLPVKVLFANTRNPLNLDEFESYMLDHENRIAPSKKGQPKDKYVDEIRSAITESLRKRALTPEERSYLGRKELVQLGAGPKLLIEANLCPFVGEVHSQRGHVRVVARILDGKTVMAIVPNPEYPHCSGRKPASELQELIYGDLITARFILRLPAEMEKGPAAARDYAGPMRLVMRLQRGFRQGQQTDEQIELKIDKEGQPKRNAPPPRSEEGPSEKREVSPAMDGQRAAAADERVTATKANKANGSAEPSKSPGRRPATNFPMDSETESDKGDEMPPKPTEAGPSTQRTSAGPSYNLGVCRPGKRAVRSSPDANPDSDAGKAKMRKVAPSDGESDECWMDIVEEAIDLTYKQGKRMKELISQAEAAVTRTVRDPSARLELLTGLVVAREKIKRNDTAGACKAALKDIQEKYQTSEQEESSSSFKTSASTSSEQNKKAGSASE